MTVIYLSSEKRDALEKELHLLKTEKRNEILERLAFAKSLGDLSENAEYHSSKEDQGKNEARISEIEAILKDAQMVEANTDGTIGIGSIVVVRKQETGQDITYTLVDERESDVASGKMALSSPFGKVLEGKKKGDVVSVTTPKGTFEYQILSVS